MIYAGGSGYLDDVPVERVLDFEAQLNEALDGKYADWIRLVHKEEALNDEVKAGLDKLLEDFKRTFS